MSTPTDQQQIRATIRRHMRNNGDADAALLAIESAVDVVGVAPVVVAACLALPLPVGPSDSSPPEFPELMGTAEVATEFGIKNSNISKLAADVRPEPVARISNGTVPVYDAADVRERAARRRGSA